MYFLPSFEVRFLDKERVQKNKNPPYLSLYWLKVFLATLLPYNFPLWKCPEPQEWDPVAQTQAILFED